MNRELIRRAVGEKAILDVARELHDETRAALMAELEPGERMQAGTLGMVYVSAPKGTHRVVDDRALLEWVREHRPDALVQTVDPLFVKGVVAAGGVTPDGEVVDGIDLVVGSPVLTVKPSVEAKAVALAQVRREVES